MLRRPTASEADVAPSVRFQTSDAVDFVGSGAAAGIIAKELSTAGFSVVVLEQGPRLAEADYDHDEFATFMQGRHANSMATQPQTFRVVQLPLHCSIASLWGVGRWELGVDRATALASTYLLM